MTNMICDECETVAHCMKNGCVPKTTKKDEALKLALEALESKYIVNCGAWRVQQDQAITVIREALTSVPDWASEVIEQPSGVATIAPVAEPRKQEPVASTKGKKLILVDHSFDDLMYWLGRCEDKGHLENCQDLVEPWEKFSYESYTTSQPPAQQNPVGEVSGHDWSTGILYQELEPGAPLYTSPPAQRTWVGLTDEEIVQGQKESWVTEQAWQSAVWWAEAKLKEKNSD